MWGSMKSLLTRISWRLIQRQLSLIGLLRIMKRIKGRSTGILRVGFPCRVFSWSKRENRTMMMKDLNLFQATLKQTSPTTSEHSTNSSSTASNNLTARTVDSYSMEHQSTTRTSSTSSWSKRKSSTERRREAKRSKQREKRKATDPKKPRAMRKAPTKKTAKM